MITRSLIATKLVKNLAKLREEIRDLSKMEQELKAEIREILGDDRLLIAGDYCVLIETRNRTDLDKEALAKEIGLDVFKKFQTKVEYEIMNVKPIKTG